MKKALKARSAALSAAREAQAQGGQCSLEPAPLEAKPCFFFSFSGVWGRFFFSFLAAKRKEKEPPVLKQC